MAAPSSALDYMGATTQKRIIPWLIDQVTKTNTFWNLLNKNAVFLDGGDYISQPIMTSLPSSAAIAYSGADTFPQNFQANEQGAVFNWKFYGISVDITGCDETRNDGIAAALDLIRLRMEEAELALRDRFGIDMQSDGTNFQGKSLLGLKIAVSNSGTYAGVSRSAFPVWQAYVNDNSASARALTTQMIDALWQNCSWDSDTPNCIVTTPGCVNKLVQLVQPLQRINEANVGVLGYKNIFYRGYPLIGDQQVQTAPFENLWGLNLRYHQIYYKRGKYFRWVPFQRMGHQDVITSKILVAMCYICSRPASNGMIDDLNSAL